MCHFVSLLFICFPNHHYHQHHRWLLWKVMTFKIWVHKWLVNTLRILTEFLQHPCSVGILSLFTNTNLRLKGSFPTSWKWRRSQIFSASILCPLHIFFWVGCPSLLWLRDCKLFQQSASLFLGPLKFIQKVLPSSRYQVIAPWQDNIYF